MSENIKFLGLFDKECSDPKYYCRCHNLFLSQSDVEFKKCYHKPTKDLISEMVCPYIQTYEEYLKEQENRCDAHRRFEARNKKKSSYSVSQPAYKSVVKRMLKEQRENG